MEMHDLCAIAARESRCMLATAIKVEGHAYRKQGVSMLLVEDGRMYGSISPGCLESDLQARVSDVLDTNQIAFVEYDMRPEDDLSWGETIGCGGLVVVLLEPVGGEVRSVMENMHESFQSGSTVIITRTFEEDFTKIHYRWKRIDPDLEASGHQTVTRPSLVVRHDRTANPHLSPVTDLSEETLNHGDMLYEKTASTQNILDIPYLTLVSEESQDIETTKSDTLRTNPWNLPQQFSSVHTPKPRLIIIGAGNDVIPVARLALTAGFRVVVADWRESLCTRDRFPESELIIGFPKEMLPQLNVNRADYIILMSHQFPRERELIEMLVDCEYTYLGIMGSKTRTARLLDGLPPMQHIHSPVGLKIGADGPEEIAISIAAELIACKRKISSLCSELPKGSVAHANDGHCSGSR